MATRDRLLTFDTKWIVTVTGRLRWWHRHDLSGRQVKGAVSLEATTHGFFRILFDGDLVDDSMAVIKPVKGRIQLPSHDSDCWKLEHKKIKSANAKGRAIVLSFDDPHDSLDRIQVSFPIGDGNGAVDDGKLFITAIEKAMEERNAARMATGWLPQP